MCRYKYNLFVILYLKGNLRFDLTAELHSGAKKSLFTVKSRLLNIKMKINRLHRVFTLLTSCLYDSLVGFDIKRFTLRSAAIN